MLLAILLMCSPGDVVLQGLGDGTTTNVVNSDQVLAFTSGQSNYAIQSVVLFGNSAPSSAKSITFRLKDSGGTQLAFGGSFLNTGLATTGTTFDLSGTAIGSYALTAGTQYQLSMYVSANSGMVMNVQNQGVNQSAGWVQDSSPGVMYTLNASAVPEPGNFLFGLIAALGGVLFWWFK